MYAPPPHPPPAYAPIFPSSRLDSGRHKLCLRLALWAASHVTRTGGEYKSRQWPFIPPSMGLLSSSSIYDSINRSISSEVVYFRLLFAATMCHQLGAEQQSVTGGSVAIHAGVKWPLTETATFSRWKSEKGESYEGRPFVL